MRLYFRRSVFKIFEESINDLPRVLSLRPKLKNALFYIQEKRPDPRPSRVKQTVTVEYSLDQHIQMHQGWVWKGSYNLTRT